MRKRTLRWRPNKRSVQAPAETTRRSRVGRPARAHNARDPVSRLSHPYPLLIRTSLALAVGLGFLIGVYLILGFAFGLPLAAASPALIQVHGQVQSFGFVALFIMAVGVQLIPRFHARPLDRPVQVSVGGLLLASGVVLRAVAQPLPVDAAGRPVMLVLAAALELVGVLLAVQAFSRVVTRSVQPIRTPVLPLTMAGSLILSLVLNAYVSLGLAEGALVVPSNQNEALLHLQLWGFASTMVLAVSARVYPRFLLLQPTREGLVPIALVLWALGSLGTPLVWLVAASRPEVRVLPAVAQLAGACLFVAALRLYETPIRASGMPHITNPTRRWARIAYAFLLSAAAATVGIAVAEWLGLQTTLTQVSAARHALAQGFLLPIIVYMAGRILPGYSGLMTRQPRLLAGLIWTLFAAAALRAPTELLGGYAPGWNVTVALGGVLAAGAFTVFAVGLWRATGEAQRRIVNVRAVAS
jgi:hypothetical protein